MSQLSLFAPAGEIECQTCGWRTNEGDDQARAEYLMGAHRLQNRHRAEPPRTVIGCVWGAHRTLAARHEGFPDYAWCERVWTEQLRKVAPAPAAVPTWLETELWAAWRKEMAR